MKRIAIVNQESCQRHNKFYVKKIIDHIQTALGAFVVFTDHAGYGQKIAQSLPGYDLVVAIGGDGTIAEIINTMDLANQALAVIPFGTGNGLAHELGISSPEIAMRAIEQNKLCAIDLMMCEFKREDVWYRRYAVTTSGLGYVVDTAAFATRHLKHMRNLCYPLATLFTLFNQRVNSADMSIEGGSVKRIEFTNFAVNNTRYAGNFCIFPDADCIDTKLNMGYARTTCFTQLLTNISVLTQKYFRYPAIKYTIRSMSVVLDGPLTFMLDGELYDSVKELRFSVATQKLKLIVR